MEFMLRVGGSLKDETMLAVGKVRYVGEPVAAVAASDLATARMAAQLIEVEYEPLPAVLTPESCARPRCSFAHEDLLTYIRALPDQSHG